MSSRASEPSSRSSVQKVDDTFSRKVLPFRRDSAGGTGVAVTAEQLQTEISALEGELENSGRSLSLTLALVVERLCALIDADGAAIALRDERGLFCGASQGLAPDVGSVLQPGSGLTRQCFETAQVVVSDDAESDSRVQLSIAQSLRLRSVLAVPIRTPDSVLGVVEVLSSRPSAFDTMHVDALQRVASALAHILVPEPPRIVVAQAAEPRPWPSRTAVIFLALLLALLGLLLGLGLTHRSASTKSALPPGFSSPTPSATQGNATADSPNNLAAPNSANSESRVPVEASPERSAPPSPIVSAGSKPLKAEAPAKEPPTPPAAAAQTTPQSTETAAGLEPVPPSASPEIAKASPAPAVVAPSIPSALISPGVSPPRFALERTLNAHAGWVTSVAFTAGGQRLAAADWDKAIDVWDVSSGQQVGAIGDIKELQAVAASNDGRWLAGEDSNNTVTVWDAASGREVRSFPGHRPSSPGRNNWVYSIAFRPDGRLLAAAVDDRTVRVWDVESGRALHDLEGHRRSVIYVAFSPDGSRLATGGDDKSIQIWDLATGRVVQTFTGHRKVVCAVAFSPNGRWLASASRDNSVKLWDLATGREIRTLTGHRDSVTTVAFSPDGRWLASGSWDKTIKIWDVETGRELYTLAGHTRHVYTVAIDSRGRWLASGSEDGVIKLWHVGKSTDQKP